MRPPALLLLPLALSACVPALRPRPAVPLAVGRVYEVVAIRFAGPLQGPTDHPTRDVDFWVRFRHEAGAEHRVHGFWDGGGDFEVRFTPTLPGSWTLAEVHGGIPALDGQHEGRFVLARPGGGHGFWVPDTLEAGGRWYGRSDGSHQFIVGNTYYDFLFRPNGRSASPQTIQGDVEDAARYFNKLRFVLMSPRPENADPAAHPFLDIVGTQTATETGRPNPDFFARRVDLAVETAARHDMIADLVLAGTAGDQAATEEAFLKYVAARYGAYPNVWFTIGQEWDEQVSAEEQRRVGTALRRYLPYPSPVSTHARSGPWDPNLNGDWADHAIRQGKLYDLSDAADAIVHDHRASGGKPVVNDENGYDPGEASTVDVVEGILGSFLGGGYGSTGEKTGEKSGGYFWGHRTQGATIASHRSPPHLGLLRAAVERLTTWWRLVPTGAPSATIFRDAPDGFRVLAEPGRQYVLGSDTAAAAIHADLPPGRWHVVQVDLVGRTETVLAERASGPFRFSTPGSRAAITIFRNEDPAAVAAAASLPPPPEPPGSVPAAGMRVLTSSADLGEGRVGRPYADDLEVAGGRGPFRWSLAAGGLPPGLRIRGTELAGVPTAPGTFHFVLTVLDDEGRRADAPLSLTIR